MAKVDQYFDLEFFMRSTDVGLYSVAKEIFSYLNPGDFINLKKIGETNEMFKNFLKKEIVFCFDNCACYSEEKFVLV